MNLREGVLAILSSFTPLIRRRTFTRRNLTHQLKLAKKVQTSSLEPCDAALTQAGSQGAAMALSDGCPVYAPIPTELPRNHTRR